VSFKKKLDYIFLLYCRVIEINNGLL